MNLFTFPHPSLPRCPRQVNLLAGYSSRSLYLREKVRARSKYTFSRETWRTRDTRGVPPPSRERHVYFARSYFSPKLQSLRNVAQSLLFTRFRSSWIVHVLHFKVAKCIGAAIAEDFGHDYDVQGHVFHWKRIYNLLLCQRLLQD